MNKNIYSIIDSIGGEIVTNKIMAHRGIFDNEKVPENSIKSFQNALKKNIPIEFDVQLTKDNILVVFHDESLKRMTGISKNIQEMTYDEIKNYPLLNTKEKIPTLKEVLTLIQDQVLYNIEIKSTKRIQETCDNLIKELSSYHNYMIQSFHPKIVRYLKKKYPHITVGYLIHSHYSSRLYQPFLSSYGMIRYTKADFLSLHKKLFLKKKFQRLRKKYPIYIWTIQKKEEMKDENCTYICNLPL